MELKVERMTGGARTRHAARAVGLTIIAAAACTGESGASREARQAGAPGAPLAVRTTELGAVRAFSFDTLSPSARIATLAPGREEDARVVAFTFSDSAHHVDAGLGVLEANPLGGESAWLPRLVWPDSVTAVWWSGAHALAFTTRTGRGVHAIANVHADTLAAVVRDSAQPAPARPRAEPVPAAARERATSFVDSTHEQPPGKGAEHSALRYVVDSLVAAPGGGLVAFYTVAVDSGGRRMNPSWYVMELPSGVVTPVDSVVGPLSEMVGTAGAWGGPDGRRFLYARGVSVREATVGR